ncbi:flagellar basal body protein [Methylomonas koyamae]|uniref:flagellar basal body protein n=1 Tax=Methylomonas koyamae TaxID=702114 RepID=UPI000AA00325|nr:flagellar basal body protein [Methylomonas koyamae]
MSSLRIFDVAGSGMNAENLRLNLVASNISNANSVSSSIDQVYKSRQPVFAAELKNIMDKNNTASGVNVLGVVENQAPPIMEYNPNHPMLTPPATSINQRQHRRGNGQHDVRIAFLPKQRRGVEHREKPDFANPENGPLR